MRATSNNRDFLIVAAIAILVEGVLIRVMSQQHASHSPGLLLIFHLPAMVLIELMQIPEPEILLICGVTGAIQLFIIFLVGWIIWQQIYGRNGF